MNHRLQEVKISLAIEYGYKMCEQGHNLQYALMNYPDNFENQVKQKIAEIIKERYSNYEPRAYMRLKKLHDTIRREVGDVLFLQFLKEKTTDPPKFKPDENLCQKS